MPDPEHPDPRLWCWNWRGPDAPFFGPCASRAEALGTPPPVAPGTEHPRLYLARCSPPLASSFLPDLDALLSGARQTAHEMGVQPDGSSIATGWLEDVTPAEHQDLLDRVGRAFDDWASQHHRHPEFFRAEDVQSLSFEQAKGLAAEYARGLLEDRRRWLHDGAGAGKPGNAGP